MVYGSYPTSGVRDVKKTRGCLGFIKSCFASARAPVRATQTALSTLVPVNRQPQMEMPMVMLRFPSSTLVRAGRGNVSRDMPGDGNLSMRDVVRPSGPVIVGCDSNECVETELRDYLVAMASGETARLPTRPDLGFRYRVKALPPTNVRLSIMPSTTAAKSKAEPKAQKMPLVEQATGRRPHPETESFKFLDVHQADSGMPFAHSVTSSTTPSSDDDDDDAYEFGTVIQDRLDKERQNVAATPQPAAAPQARQAGERMPLSGFSSEEEDENRAIAMARPVSHQRAVPVDSKFVSSESVHVPMARPVSHPRALSVEPNFVSSASIRVPIARPVSHRRMPSIASDILGRRSGSCLGRIEQNDPTAVVADQVPALGPNPQCTAMLFASPSEGCMLRFAHLWDDGDAAPIDQSLFADFDQTCSREMAPSETAPDVSDVATDLRSKFWSVVDAVFAYGGSVQTSDTSMDSRRYSWAGGDEDGYNGLFVQGRGGLGRPQRFGSLPVVEPARSDFAHQQQELSKGRHTRRTFDDFDKFYRLRKGRTMSTVPNGW